MSRHETKGRDAEGDGHTNRFVRIAASSSRRGVVGPCFRC